jgi:small subunit ribosomal protein S15e
MIEKKKKTFRKFSYRGLELKTLIDLSIQNLVKILPARARRKLSRGLQQKPITLIRKLRRAKKKISPQEKPERIKTHLRNMIIVPEMVGSQIDVYNGKIFSNFEVKPQMIGHYLGEFSITYKPVKHGRPGVGASGSSRFVPLK